MNDFKDIPAGYPESVFQNGPEIKVGDIPISPITIPEVKKIVDAQYRQNFEPISYTTQRGVDQLLTEEIDYARLPDLPGRKAIQMFRDLPEGSGFLDVGCGSGTFIKEVVTKVNPEIEAYGFDSRTWEDQEELPHLNLGNIDDLPSIDFGRDKFDIVTSASVLYHLPDYWGAILRMADRLKPKGVLLTSTVPRVVETTVRDGVVSYGDPVDDETGRISKSDYGQSGYYRSRNIFGTDGKIVPMTDVIQTINECNPNFRLRYSVSPADNVGTGQYGGQIAAVREGVQPLNLSCLFYCNYPLDRKYGPISYILGKTEEERKMLQQKGFISVQERFGH